MADMQYRKSSYGVCTPGFKASGVRRGRYGVALVVSESDCVSVAVYTRNSVKAAPIQYTKKRDRGVYRAVVANSGNANCCVEKGLTDAEYMANAAGKILGLKPDQVAVSSTGVIGRRMDVKVVGELIGEASTKLSGSSKGSIQAAKAIMTTDTTIKTYSVEKDGLYVGGICKGAGMIEPNMATMLCYVTTNARLTRKQLRDCLREAVEESFNMVSVEGDMSTNDTVMLFSNRLKRCGLGVFKRSLKHVLKEMAKMIARDGEGSSKFMEVEVRGAKTKAEAKKVVKAVTNSPLVKTALYGVNPNWGRIIAAAGSAAKISWDKVDLYFTAGKSSVKVLSQGKSTRSKKAKDVLRAKELKIVLDLHRGRSSSVGWGCDMTPEYVRINAGYN